MMVRKSRFTTRPPMANEIWLDDMKALFPLKSKFFLEGTPAGFSSAQLAYEQLTDNLYSYELPGIPRRPMVSL